MDGDRIREILGEMAENEELEPAKRLRAIEQLREMMAAEAAPEPSSPADPLAAMWRVVERHCPGHDGLDATPADPMRDQEFAMHFIRLGRPPRLPDPLFMSWVPYCPAADPVQAEREIASAARRLGVGMGPYDVPEWTDELAERRRSQRRGG